MMRAVGFAAGRESLGLASSWSQVRTILSSTALGQALVCGR